MNRRTLIVSYIRVKPAAAPISMNIITHGFKIVCRLRVSLIHNTKKHLIYLGFSEHWVGVIIKVTLTVVL